MTRSYDDAKREYDELSEIALAMTLDEQELNYRYPDNIWDDILIDIRYAEQAMIEAEVGA